MRARSRLLYPLRLFIQSGSLFNGKLSPAYGSQVILERAIVEFCLRAEVILRPARSRSAQAEITDADQSAYGLDEHKNAHRRNALSPAVDFIRPLVTKVHALVAVLDFRA